MAKLTESKSEPKRVMAPVTTDFSGRRSKSARVLLLDLKARGYFDPDKPRRPVFRHLSR
jgi:hypothetical protein